MTAERYPSYLEAEQSIVPKEFQPFNKVCLYNLLQHPLNLPPFESWIFQLFSFFAIQVMNEDVMPLPV